MKISSPRLMLSVFVLTFSLAGCATFDGILRDLGLSHTDKVEQVSLIPINEQYEFIQTGNVRTAPNLNAMVIGSLKAGTRFIALGRTDNNWIAISDTSGKRLGYVHASLVQKAGAKKVKKTRKSSRKSNTAQASSSSAGQSNQAETGVDLDAMPDSDPKATSKTNSEATSKTSTSQGVNLDDL